MNRALPGVLLGLAVGIADLLMMPMKFPDKTAALLGAFFSFAVSGASEAASLHRYSTLFSRIHFHSRIHCPGRVTDDHKLRKSCTQLIVRM